MLQFYLSMMNSGEDKALVEFLYNEYKQIMFKTAYAILHNRERAEDAVHDAFLRVINHLFRSYSCKENVSYLVIIVRGIALNMVSKSNRQAELDEETPDGMSVEDSVLSELAYEEIVENIKALSPALRDIAYLSFVENCSAGEISELLDMKINTVHSSISRARKIISRKHTENNQ
jgi:RNA polymerase sigma-70 factor (ECF subfamily)